MIKLYGATYKNRIPLTGRSGFTLTEVAIVLGIIGLILGSIWVAASSVYANVKTANAQRSILATAQAVRSMYTMARGNTGATSATLITAPGMLPLDYVSGSVYVNPWNLSSTVSTSYVVGSGTTFAIEFDGISNAACVSLLNSFSSAAAATPLLTVISLAWLAITQVTTAVPILARIQHPSLQWLGQLHPPT